MNLHVLVATGLLLIAAPARGQMLVGFLKSADEPPADTDPAFGGMEAKAQVVALDQFGAICDPMM